MTEPDTAGSTAARGPANEPATGWMQTITDRRLPTLTGCPD
jgi:hypothetical protein